MGLALFAWQSLRPWVEVDSFEVAFDPPRSGLHKAGFSADLATVRLAGGGLFDGAKAAHARHEIVLLGLALHHRGAQANDRLGVQLAGARLGHAEHVADLAERVVLLVIETQERLQSLGELTHRVRETLASFGAKELVVGRFGGVVAQLEPLDALASGR